MDYGLRATARWVKVSRVISAVRSSVHLHITHLVTSTPDCTSPQLALSQRDHVLRPAFRRSGRPIASARSHPINLLSGWNVSIQDSCIHVVTILIDVNMVLVPPCRTLFTGGSDCMLRYHNVNEPDTEPGFFDEHRDPITCLATTASRFRPQLARWPVRIASN
jgi:hypothetical protein